MSLKLDAHYRAICVNELHTFKHQQHALLKTICKVNLYLTFKCGSRHPSLSYIKSIIYMGSQSGVSDNGWACAFIEEIMVCAWIHSLSTWLQTKKNAPHSFKIYSDSFKLLVGENIPNISDVKVIGRQACLFDRITRIDIQWVQSYIIGQLPLEQDASGLKTWR